LGCSMRFVRSYWRKDGTLVDAHLRRGGGGDFSADRKLRIVCRLIENGARKEDLSLEYQRLWDAAHAFMDRGFKSEWEASLPPGGVWVTESLYEVNGLAYLRPGS
jgi:hypothetical protein